MAQHDSPIAVESEPTPCEQAPAKAFGLLHPEDIDATSTRPAHHLASPGPDPQKHEGLAPKTGHHDGSDMSNTACYPSTNPPPKPHGRKYSCTSRGNERRQVSLRWLMKGRAALDQQPIKQDLNLSRAWLHWSKDDGSSTPLSRFSP